MNKKRTLKIIAIVLTTIMLVAATTSVFAGSAVKPSDIDPNKSKVDVGGITDLGNSIVKILSTIGIVVSVIVLVVLGIKYMMGSAEEKAEYKKTMIPYLVGAGLVFAASSIATVVYNFMQNI